MIDLAGAEGYLTPEIIADLEKKLAEMENDNKGADQERA